MRIATRSPLLSANGTEMNIVRHIAFDGIAMPHLVPIDTAAPDFAPATITDAEAAAMFRACPNLFRLWEVSDLQAAILLDLLVRSCA